MTKLKKFKPLSSNLSSTSKVNHIPTKLRNDWKTHWWNMLISQFGGTESFLNLVQHGHFSIWWNTVISQFCGTLSFLHFPDLVEHGHFYIFPIWWNTVIFQFCGTQSYLNLVEHSYRKVTQKTTSNSSALHVDR